jgi:hypothetical protein
MTRPVKLNSAQIELLQSISSKNDTNLLKLRNKLSWDLEKFSVTLHTLEVAKLIIRDGFKASATMEGLKVIGARFQVSSGSVPDGEQVSYVDEVSVPPLSLSEPWLPNLENFLGAIGIRK